MACKRTKLTLLGILISCLVVSSACAGITATDDSGRNVGLNHPAARVVSLYVGHSENIEALGAGDKLVAVSRTDDPQLFPGLPRFSSRVDPEAILSIDPDLVLVRPMFERGHKDFVETLERSGIKVFSLNPPSWDGMETYLGKLGVLLGVTDPGKIWAERLADMKRVKVESDRRRGDFRPVRVFLESVGKGVKTCSPDSWAARLIEYAGGINVAEDALPVRKGSSIAPFGDEALLKEISSGGLDVYLVQVGAMNRVTMEDVMKRPWIKGLGKARISLVEEDLVSRPSLYRMVDGAETLLDIFYPEGGKDR